MIKLNLKPPTHVLRQFAWIAAFALPVLAAFFTSPARWYQPWAWSWATPLVGWLALAGAAQLALLLIGVRHVTLVLYVVLMVVAFPIGFVVSHTLLAAIYYLVITPIGLFFRVTGRDVIGRRIERTKATYWHERGQPRPADSYFKLY
jgi:hypothetical protein